MGVDDPYGWVKAIREQIKNGVARATLYQLSAASRVEDGCSCCAKRAAPKRAAPARALTIVDCADPKGITDDDRPGIVALEPVSNPGGGYGEQ